MGHTRRVVSGWPEGVLGQIGSVGDHTGSQNTQQRAEELKWGQAVFRQTQIVHTAYKRFLGQSRLGGAGGE